MKKFVILALLSATTFSFAQQKPKAKPVVSTTAAVAAPITGDKETMLAKAWKLDSIENFGVTSATTGKQKGDGVTLIAGGDAFLTVHGTPKTGKWNLDKAKANVLIEIDGGEKFRFRILALTNDM